VKNIDRQEWLIGRRGLLFICLLYAGLWLAASHSYPVVDTFAAKEENSHERAAGEGVGGGNERLARIGAENTAALSAGGALHAWARPEMAREARARFKSKLVPRTRSSHHNCRESDCELRVQSGTRIIGLLVSFDSEVRIGACGKIGRTSESGH
jgi:hypothetical protein